MLRAACMMNCQITSLFSVLSRSPRRVRSVLLLMVSALLLTLTPGVAAARALDSSTRPAWRYPFRAGAQVGENFQTRLHYVGEVWFAISVFGRIGTGIGDDVVDRKDKEQLGIIYSPSFEFPAGTRNDYLYAGGLWVGGIVGTDTLVSLPIDAVSDESNTEFVSYDSMTEVSSLRTSPYYDPDAKAPQQYHAVFYDTSVAFAGTDELDQRPHHPLHIEVSQTSYAWSDAFSRQFVIVQNWIKNIGTKPINKLALGLFMDADVLNENTTSGASGAEDDISGFLGGAPDLNLPQFRDSLDVAWVADNDGDPVGGTFPLFSPRGAVGIRILDAPPSKHLSFNWWLLAQSNAQQWGPVKAGARIPDPGGSLGPPVGDRNRYYVMTNGEIDYGQVYAALDFTDQGWRPPLKGSAGCGIADGLDTRQLLSVGPACDPLLPGDSVPFVYALMGGTKFHTDPTLVFDCKNPDDFMRQVSFKDFFFAATWAGWIYDTPGFDSDSDGYKGEFRAVSCDSVVNGVGFGCDTVPYTGDIGPSPGPGRPPCQSFGGRPDFAAPAGPPCPMAGTDFTVETRPNEIVVRWSGRSIEPFPDPLSHKIDFEGYRLYTARNNSTDQYSLVASWDVEDYNQFVYNPAPPGSWDRIGDPVSIDSLRVLFGDAVADSIHQGFYREPSNGSCFRDQVVNDSGMVEERCSYFEPQDDNRTNRYVENGDTVSNIIQHITDSTVVDGKDTLVFGVYEAHITGLNPSQGLYVSVTAFDFGNFEINLGPLGSSPGDCFIFAIPIYSSDVVVDSGLKVGVFPNPYKISFEGANGQRTTYFEQGNEGINRQGGEFREQDRRIWFINLPDTATIRIYTLDGDLVREIHHPDPFLTDYSSRAAWDLVTRNTQAAVSGIYIWRVDSDRGSQVGKLVIIK